MLKTSETNYFNMNEMDIKPPMKKSVSFNVPEISNITEFWTQANSEGSYRKQDSVIKILLNKETEDSVLSSWFKQLKDNIFFLDKDNERITSALLSIDWTQRNNEVVSAYQELILNLVSAHTIYLTPVLQMIIKFFSSALNESVIISKEEQDCYNECHKLLQGIVCLIPSAPDILSSLLADKFPYIRKPSHIILRYVVNMLQVTTYLSSHRLIILTHLTDKILEIDIRSPRDAIELAGIEKEENDDIPMDLDSTEKSIAVMAHPLADTLDLIMQHLFTYIDTICHDESEKKVLNWEVTKKLFREILTIFDQLILPTHLCNHIQFLLFYICSWRLVLCEGFLDYLWKKVKNPNTAPIRRQVATFYIGSFLSRATFISINTVTACFDMICEWVHSYINSYDSRICVDFATHGTFHCVCQMLFYVFAFRHKEFINMKNGFRYLRNLNFERIVSCRLNPLKFCLPVIVQNFASVARNYQIAYCYPIIERNNRSLTSGMIHVNNFAALKWFFPFDPYLLKRSQKFIEPIYRIYKNSESEEPIINEEEDKRSENTELQALHSALFSYGTSPGFKTVPNTPPDIR